MSDVKARTFQAADRAAFVTGDHIKEQVDDLVTGFRNALREVGVLGAEVEVLRDAFLDVYDEAARVAALPGEFPRPSSIVLGFVTKLADEVREGRPITVGGSEGEAPAEAGEDAASCLCLRDERTAIVDVHPDCPLHVEGEPPRCCYIYEQATGCDEEAEYQIFGLRPDNSTEGCADHVGHLLGVISEHEPFDWRVVPLRPVVEFRDR